MGKNMKSNSQTIGKNLELHDLEQRSPEWFNIRMGRVSGTSLKDLMLKKPVKSSALFFRIMAELDGDQEREETFTSKAMQRGIDLEPIAREAAGAEFKEYGFFTRGKFAGLSPDGLTEDFKHGLEIKCPLGAVHKKYLIENKIPSEYRWQIVQYFYVIDTLEDLLFYSYRPENTAFPEFRLLIKREDLAEDLEAVEKRFKELEEAIEKWS